MDKTIKIADKIIGENQPCFIIGEAGVNHNGEIRIAKQLIDVAKDAGCDAVKFQTFKAENLATKTIDMAKYQKENTGKKQTQFQMLKKLELSKKQHLELKKYCAKKRIIFLSTPFDFESAELVNSLCSAFKISSGDLNNYPFLEHIARKGKPIILSTGMATLGEIKKAVGAIAKNKNNQLVLLHCVSSYPTSLEDANIRAMFDLKKTGVNIIGYSDHTLGYCASLAAVALGAKIIEKHMTLNKKMNGPDHISSLEPQELKEMVKTIRDIEKTLGDGKKKPAKVELANRNIVRKKIVALKDIKKGILLTEELITLKRSGRGAEPERFYKIMGKRTKRNIKKEEGILLEDVE